MRVCCASTLHGTCHLVFLFFQTSTKLHFPRVWNTTQTWDMNFSGDKAQASILFQYVDFINGENEWPVLFVRHSCYTALCMEMIINNITCMLTLFFISGINFCEGYHQLHVSYWNMCLLQLFMYFSQGIMALIKCRVHQDKEKRKNNKCGNCLVRRGNAMFSRDSLPHIVSDFCCD